RKFIFYRNRLVGTILLGEIEKAGIFSLLIRKMVDVSSLKEIFIEKEFNYAKIIPFILDNPEIFKEKEFNDTLLSLQKEFVS
ncbi:MAG: hypothetical protein ACK4NT_02190, partial [Candidatus Omnitrophota bacterium]